jgi:hypothetical protein
MKKQLFIALSFLAGQVLADDLKEFVFEIPSQALQDQPTKPRECKFEGLRIPNNAVVYAAGAYSGRETNFQIDQSGHAATQFDIVINSKKRPVLLMLGAYEPTIWNLGWSTGTEILAVVVSGYHRQVVAGLESDVPVLNSSYDNQGPCGHYYIEKSDNRLLKRKSKKLFGQPVEHLYVGSETGKIVVGESISPADKLVTAANRSLDAVLKEIAR